MVVNSRSDQESVCTRLCIRRTRTGIRFKTRRNRGGGSDNTYYERLRMINVGKAFTWDLLGSAYYMGELAARYPARKVNR